VYRFLFCLIRDNVDKDNEEVAAGEDDVIGVEGDVNGVEEDVIDSFVLFSSSFSDESCKKQKKKFRNFI
jgi:polyribonucleotide nucleotidyltransferase